MLEVLSEVFTEVCIYSFGILSQSLANPEEFKQIQSSLPLFNAPDERLLALHEEWAKQVTPANLPAGSSLP